MPYTNKKKKNLNTQQCSVFTLGSAQRYTIQAIQPGSATCRESSLTPELSSLAFREYGYRAEGFLIVTHLFLPWYLTYCVNNIKCSHIFTLSNMFLAIAITFFYFSYSLFGGRDLGDIQRCSGAIPDLYSGTASHPTGSVPGMYQIWTSFMQNTYSDY